MRRDDPDVFEVKRAGPPSLSFPAQAVIQALEGVVTEARYRRITEVVRGRTHRVAMVLEDVTDPHNTSAVMRSCDAFGVQNVHVIPGPRGFQAAHAVSKGSHRWLDLHVHESPEACATALHAEGYRILYASMEGTTRPEQLSELGKVAIVFGNEHRGPSPALRALADGSYAIPMRGFVDSLNVSVAAAITLFSATQKGDLTEPEREALVARYLLGSVKDGDRIVQESLLQGGA
ncbi:MAG: RNA methyltransferase [Myxococcota bacterium]